MGRNGSKENTLPFICITNKINVHSEPVISSIAPVMVKRMSVLLFFNTTKINTMLAVNITADTLRKMYSLTMASNPATVNTNSNTQ